MAPLLLLALSTTGLAGCKRPDDIRGPTPTLAVAPGSVANGNKPACQLPDDSTRPELPNTGMTFPKDTTLVNSFPGDTVTVFYRNIFGVRFHDSTSGTTIRQMLQQFKGEIIGGLPNTGEYIVRFPDPGSGFAAFNALETEINAVPGVEYATPMVRRSGSSTGGLRVSPSTGASSAPREGTSVSGDQ